MTQTSEVVSYKPIGILRTPHTISKKTPIQPVYAKGIRAKAIIHQQYVDGLQDIEGFSHVVLIYHLHKAKEPHLIIKPYMQDIFRGVFATRSPHRPNPIGMSVVKLIRHDGNVLEVEDIDILDDTPLLDIKPYIARFDILPDIRSGWQQEIDEDTAQRRGRREYDPSESTQDD